MLPRNVCVLAAVLLGACSGRAGVPSFADGGVAAGDAERAGSADAPAVPDAAPGDAALGPAGGGDGGLAVEPSDGGWARAVTVTAERYDQFSNRIVECFNSSRALLANRSEPPDADPEVSFELGQVKVDERAARACLAALGSATCDELARAATGNDIDWAVGPLEPCSRILLRQPGGGQCGHDEACQSLQCRPGMDSCRYAGVCEPLPTPAGPGESCMNAPCASGTFCDGNVCRRLGRDGEACSGPESCATGFHCARSTSGGAVCRPVQRGAACTSSLQCPRVFSCVRAAGGGAGTCQPGKRVGEPCVPEGVEDPGSGRPALSDCGYLLQCLNIGGAGFRCHAGNRLGERCGRLPELNTYVECVEGYCDLPQLVDIGLCRPRQSSGPCSRSEACIPPSECREWDGSTLSCRTPPPPKPLGAACTTANGADCGHFNYCRPKVAPADPGTASDGLCARRKKLGEPCVAGWDKCDLATQCNNGVCTKC